MKIQRQSVVQVPVSSPMRTLNEVELDAVVGGVKITVTNKKGEKVVIEL